MVVFYPAVLSDLLICHDEIECKAVTKMSVFHLPLWGVGDPESGDTDPTQISLLLSTPVYDVTK